jgi:methyl-accepting chemotaxis protein
VAGNGVPARIARQAPGPGQDIIMAQTRFDNDLDFFGLTASDWKRLERIRRVIARKGPKALDRFYDRVAGKPETSRFFADRSGMMSAKAKQLEHWQHLFGRAPDATYFERAGRIGAVHARIGLEPKWHVGGYASIIEDIIISIMRSTPMGLVDGGRTAGTIATLVKMALLDMTVALSAYFEVEEERRLQVIEKLGGALNSMAAGDFSTRLDELPAEYARIQTDFSNMRARINSALAEVAEVSDSIKTGAMEIQLASDDLARRT